MMGNCQVRFLGGRDVATHSLLPDKQTAGIDGQIALTNDERVKLVTQTKEHSLWKVRPTKRVYIAFLGKMRYNITDTHSGG